MGDDELRSALRSGSTLASLAKDRGLSQDDLVAAVKSGLEAAGPPGRAGAAGRRPDGDGADMAQRLQSLTSALGMDESSFFDALSSGTSLKDLAAQHDVTSDQLRSLLLGPVKVDAAA